MPKLHPNKKILKLISLLKDRGDIRYDTDFCRAIGMANTYLNMIKHHDRNFSLEQIESICKTFNVNANYIFGTEKNPFLSSEIKEVKSNREALKELRENSLN